MLRLKQLTKNSSRFHRAYILVGLRGACELLLAYFVLISQVGFHDPIGVCDKESQRMWPHVEVKFQGGYIPLML